MAEITNDEKGKISHRGNAIRLLKEYLEGEQHVYGLFLVIITKKQVSYIIFMNYIKMQINFTFRDSEFSYNDTELSLYQRVKGNCDFYPEFLEEAITEETESVPLYSWTSLSSKPNTNETG